MRYKVIALFICIFIVLIIILVRIGTVMPTHKVTNGVPTKVLEQAGVIEATLVNTAIPTEETIVFKAVLSKNIFHRINDLRVERGLFPFKFNNALAVKALAYCSIVVKDIESFEHIWYDKGINVIVTRNLHISSDEVVDMWFNSLFGQDNLFSSKESIGIGQLNWKGNLVIVALYS